MISTPSAHRFRTLSLSEAGARQLRANGKEVSVVRHELAVSHETLEHARAVGQANHWARKLLFRGVANNARLSHCDKRVRDRALDLLTAELEEIRLHYSDPWQHLVARCRAIARHGIGHCHECSDLTFLYLVATLPDCQIDQATYPHRDHVATLVQSGAHVIRCDPWTTVAVPVLQGHGNKRLDVDLMAANLSTMGLGSNFEAGKILRSSKGITAQQRRMLSKAVAELDSLTPADCLSDKAILEATAPAGTKRSEASMDPGTEWPLSKRRPVTALVHDDERLDLDSYGVNEYFHALLNPLPRRGDTPFPAGCFDFADAIERLLGNDPQPLLGLVEHHGFDPDAVVPLLAELFDLAISDEPTRQDAALKLKAAWPATAEAINS